MTESTIPAGLRPRTDRPAKPISLRPVIDPRDAALAKVAAQVQRMHGVTLEELRSPRKTRRISDARLSYYLMARQTGESVTRIGEFIYRDHSCVVKGATNDRVQASMFWMAGDGEGI